MRLRAEIANSWQRTASAGLDPGATVDPEDVADYDPASRLRRAARPVLDAVAEHLAGTRYGVVLADHDSCIVDARFGRAELEARLASVGAVAGKTFTEAITGTNSIATAAETHSGVAVHGEEHYLESFKPFACFGAPIREPLTRRHAGVLDITCFAEDAAPLLRPFLLRAVDDIETSLLENTRHSHRRVLAAFEAARPRAGALLAFGPDLVLANDAATEMLAPSDHTMLQLLCAERPDNARRSVELASGAHTVIEIEHLGGGHLVRLEPSVRPSPIPRRAVRPDFAPGSLDWHAELVGTVEQYRDAAASVLVRGEPGTGRTTVAHRLAGGGPVAVVSCPVETAAVVEHLVAELVGADGEDVRTLVVDDADLLTMEVEAVIARLVDGHRLRLVLTSAAPTTRGRAAMLTARCPVRLDLEALHHARSRLPGFAAALLRDRTRGAARFTPSALLLLAEMGWPGNLRELEALVNHVAAHRTAGDITIGDLPPGYREQPGTVVRGALRQAERDTIVRALTQCCGNKVHAAEQLGISRNTLYRRVRELRIDMEAIRGRP